MTVRYHVHRTYMYSKGWWLCWLGGIVPSTFKYIIYLYLYNCREINLQANMAGNFFGQTYFETHM